MALTNKMKAYIEAKIANPYMSQTELCKEIHITDAIASRWKAKPEFNQAMEEALKEHWKAAESQAVAKIIELTNSNREDIALKAATYITDSLGYKSADKVEVKADNTVHIDIDYGE